MEFEVPMMWIPRWLLGGNMGCSYLAGSVVVTVNWVNAYKAQGLPPSMLSANDGSPTNGG